MSSINSEFESAEDIHEHEFQLEHCEILADTVAQTDAERHMQRLQHVNIF